MLPSGATALGVAFSLRSTGTATVDDLSLSDPDAAPLKADQTITFDAPSGVRFGDPDSDLGATASSGLPVTYTSQTPSVCTIVSGQLHVVAPGPCTVDADQAGDDNYNPAPQVSHTFTIGKADQTITFDAPTGVRFGDPDSDLGATATSGLAGHLHQPDAVSVCTIVSGQLHVVAPAPARSTPTRPATTTTTPRRRSSRRSRSPRPTRRSPSTPPPASATATPTRTSARPPPRASRSPTPARRRRLHDRRRPAARRGSPAPARWTPTRPATTTTTRAPGRRTRLRSARPTRRSPSTPPAACASATPTQTSAPPPPRACRSPTPARRRRLHDRLRPAARGGCRPLHGGRRPGRRRQLQPAPQVAHTFAIGKADQTITFDAPSGVRFGDPDSDLGATASSGLPVTYTSQTPRSARSSPASCTWWLPAPARWTPTRPATTTTTRRPRCRTRLRSARPTRRSPSTPPAACASATPTQTSAPPPPRACPVTYTSQTPSVCTIVSGQLHTVAPGPCTMDADQAGDDNYNPAPQVTRTFEIARMAIRVRRAGRRRMSHSSPPMKTASRPIGPTTRRCRSTPAIRPSRPRRS